MPDVEKLFAQQHPPDQSAAIVVVVDVPTSAAVSSNDSSSSVPTAVQPTTATAASSTSSLIGVVRHCPPTTTTISSAKSILETGAADFVEDEDDEIGENQIPSSRPLASSNNEDEQLHSASLNCRAPSGAEVEGGSLPTTDDEYGYDRSFIIDRRTSMLLTSSEEDGGDCGLVAISDEDENASSAAGDVLSETAPSSTAAASAARFGHGGGKYAAPNGNGANGHLATVLENLPLPSEIDCDQENNMRPASPSANGSSSKENHSGAIGHSRSAHSFGPADSVAVAHYMQQQQQQQQQTPENRRTHARHSSYEVPSSTSQQQRTGQLVSTCLTANGAGLSSSGAPFGRTNSLSRTGTDASSFSSSFSISSLSYSDYSASLASITDSNGGDSQPHFYHHHQQQDENSSKRSSLDRRSLTSYCSSSSNDDGNGGGGGNGVACGSGFGQRINDIVSGGGATSGESSGTTGNHKRLLTNILPRGLFSRKTLTITPNTTNNAQSNDNAANNNHQNHAANGTTSWKLPFRPPAALASTLGSALSLSLSSTSLAANHATAGKNHTVNKELAADAPSTTALILQDRPATLPPKSAEEEQKHRHLYEQMIEAAKKKEQREAKQRKKQQRLQLKQEDALSAAVKEWTSDILPRWDEVKNTKRVREQWGNGLPPCVRGKVWKLAVGNELSITEELFEICVNRAKERLRQFEEASSNHQQQRASSPNGNTTSRTSSPTSTSFHTPPTTPSSTTTMTSATESPVDREGTVELIHLDVARTFPVLGIFQKGGPYYDLLLNVLGAYACYRPDVGYVQGMSFLAAVLLLNMDAPDTFIVFANLMNRPCQLAFFRLRQAEMERYFLAYDRFFHECLPKLYAHFKSLDVRPNLYLIEWLYTLYAKSLPLEITCRIWDVFVRDGEEFLFRTAIGLLHHFEDDLLRADFDRCVQFLTHLPDNLRATDLFRAIDEAAPSASSTFSFGPAVRHSTCHGVGGGGEKRRFIHFFNELAAETRSSSSAGASGCSSPTITNGHHHAPSLLFNYASNLLHTASPSCSNSQSSSRRESAAASTAVATTNKNTSDAESESEMKQSSSSKLEESPRGETKEDVVDGIEVEPNMRR